MTRLWEEGELPVTASKTIPVQLLTGSIFCLKWLESRYSPKALSDTRTIHCNENYPCLTKCATLPTLAGISGETTSVIALEACSDGREEP